MQGALDRRRMVQLLGGATLALCSGLGGTAWAQSSPRAKPPARRPLIMLDPGHGGVDPGAIGRSGLFEKDVALATAREAARQLEATRRYRVELTRNDDEFIPLGGRV